MLESRKTDPFVICSAYRPDASFDTTRVAPRQFHCRHRVVQTQLAMTFSDLARAAVRDVRARRCRVAEPRRPC